ncbi:SRPBCC family protein [Streptosporangium sp. G11]|uniref:SRPBCC family protein n=1 Tax=Streptosporangium sp. G11 TaxID=3436926 RepID=UPI003EB9554B
MASIRTEVVINSSQEKVWAAIRDVGAVHRRLLPDRVADTHIEGDVRTLVFPNGKVIRELIVDVDDTTRRLAYAVVEGAQPALTHHHASFQVLPEESGRTRLVWITDVLPDAHAAEIRVRVERGAADMKRTLEEAEEAEEAVAD